MIPFVKYPTTPVVLDRQHSPPSEGCAGPHRRLRGRTTRRALIVGVGDVGRELARSLEESERYQIVGFVDDQYNLPFYDDYDLLGGKDDIEKVIDDYAVDEVFVAYAPTWQQVMVGQLAVAHPEVKLHVVPTSYEAMMNLGRVTSCGDIALVELFGGTQRFKEGVKRVFDLSVSLVALLLLLPLLLAVTALIKLVSPGPAIFAQERVGRNGRPFILYKFRTMVHNAESKTGPTLANGKNDPRLTSVGRWLRLFRIDEIPQLWNVVKGDMSIVGPRPERPYFVKKYERMIPTYGKRHQVRPGITGLAQVLGGYHTDARDKLRFDLIYASHQSLWLDLVILFRTIIVCILPKRYNWGGS